MDASLFLKLIKLQQSASVAREKSLNSELMENRTAVAPAKANLYHSESKVQQQKKDKEVSSEMPAFLITSCEDKWSKDNFEIQELLFEGPHCEMYRIMHKETEELASLKILMRHYQYKSKYLSEEYIWRVASRHPNIVKFYSSYRIDDNTKAYVSEFLSHGTLRHFIKIHKVLQTRVSKLLAAQVTSAIEFLHSKDIFHRDVSSRCIYLNADGQAKLSGFTHALMNKTARGIHGNLYYQAPEVFSGGIYDRTADWYSLGVCLYEMVMGMTPAEYHCLCNGIGFKKLDYTGKIVVMLTTSVYIPKIFPKNLRTMLEGLLQKSKEKRFGHKENVEAIKKHPFFDSVDWEKIESGSLKVNLPKDKRPSVDPIPNVLNK